jgi:hypothetical protein
MLPCKGQAAAGLLSPNSVGDDERTIGKTHRISRSLCGRVCNMPETNENVSEAAASIAKAKSIIRGPFKPLTDQIIDQDVKLPLVKLFEVADLQNQALEKLQIELERLTTH